MDGFDVPQQLWGYIYNIFFHPCSRFPGPVLFGMSQVPNLYYSWLGTKHLKVMDLHKRYGMLNSLTWPPLVDRLADHERVQVMLSG